MISTDPLPADKAGRIAALRARYFALKAAGEGAAAPLPLPAPSRRDLPLAEGPVLWRETLPGGWYTTVQLARFDRLRIVNSGATPGVSVLLWQRDEPSERYNSADTVKVQWTAALQKGRLLLSDMGRVMASLVEDSCAAHDALAGGSTPQSNVRNFGDGALRNSRENFRLAAGKHGLGRLDIPPCVTFFAPVTVGEGGRLSWQDRRVVPGDFVELRAEMPLLVALSNCPHPLAPDRVYAPTPVELVVYRGPPPEPGDMCRGATAEARRGFENTDARFGTVTP